jgi:L-amino acid N-acyltransferase YncA
MADLGASQIKIKVGGEGSCIGTFYNNGAANVMIIDNVKVRKKSRGKGIGTAVMEKAISIAHKRNIDSVELVVNSDNEIAKRLYKKVGFEKTNKEYYRLILNKKK